MSYQIVDIRELDRAIHAAMFANASQTLDEARLTNTRNLALQILAENQEGTLTEELRRLFGNFYSLLQGQTSHTQHPLRYTSPYNQATAPAAAALRALEEGGRHYLLEEPKDSVAAALIAVNIYSGGPIPKVKAENVNDRDSDAVFRGILRQVAGTDRLFPGIAKSLRSARSAVAGTADALGSVAPQDNAMSALYRLNVSPNLSLKDFLRNISAVVMELPALTSPKLEQPSLAIGLEIPNYVKIIHHVRLIEDFLNAPSHEPAKLAEIKKAADGILLYIANNSTKQTRAQAMALRVRLDQIVNQAPPATPDALDIRNKTAVLAYLDKSFPTLFQTSPQRSGLAATFGVREEEATWPGAKTAWGLLRKAASFFKPPVPAPTKDQIEEEVWKIWEDALNSNVKADSLIFDLDDTTYNYDTILLLLSAFGEEAISPRYVAIMLLALYHRDQANAKYATHTAAPRLLEIFKKIPGLREAFIGNAPATLETLGPGTYSNLAYGSLAALDKFIKNNFDFSILNEREQLIVANKLVDVFGSYRGSKILAADPNRILFDDSYNKVVDYVMGGGRGGVVTGKKNNYAPQVMLAVVESLEELNDLLPNTNFIVDLRKSLAAQTMAMPPVAIHHDSSAIAISYAPSSVASALVTIRDILFKLRHLGRAAEVRAQAKQIILARKNKIIFVDPVFDKTGVNIVDCTFRNLSGKNISLRSLNPTPTTPSTTPARTRTIRQPPAARSARFVRTR